MSARSSEITRSTLGSSANATAGGKSRGRAAVGADGPALGIETVAAGERAAISNGSWDGNVRVAFGITVLLKRSLLGLSSGATGAATGRSFLARAWSLTFLKKLRNGIVMVI